MSDVYAGSLKQRATVASWQEGDVLNVLIIDDHNLFRSGLRLLLSDLDEGIGFLESEGVEQATQYFGQHVQIVLLDMNLRGVSGLDALREVRRGLPDATIVALSSEEDLSLVRDVIEAGKPFLGICLGLQLLFDVSYERGEYEGLGIVPGKVVKFDLPREYKVPHMGWNTVEKTRPIEILSGMKDHSHMYFVHSYYVVPDDSDVIALESDYGGSFCAMIARDNLYATQFHPEKSQADGLQILKGFGELGAVAS